jgi:hypothetical protein
MTQPIAINDRADVLGFSFHRLPFPSRERRSWLSRGAWAFDAAVLTHKTGSRGAHSRFKSGFRLSCATIRDSLWAPQN